MNTVVIEQTLVIILVDRTCCKLYEKSESQAMVLHINFLDHGVGVRTVHPQMSCEGEITLFFESLQEDF